MPYQDLYTGFQGSTEPPMWADLPPADGLEEGDGGGLFSGLTGFLSDTKESINETVQGALRAPTASGSPDAGQGIRIAEFGLDGVTLAPGGQRLLLIGAALVVALVVFQK
ncbi:hypothetical protein [Tropicibacter alexandrii]|uniref:hypothetical protein n=1 Tax=Tropicibacter alexandrii TaxID=2267683 RepID=UPI000EF54FB3|nr:hypothetical protein [Tropicibacter alexandrii]